MKTLVVYYSLSGVTKAFANTVAKELGADSEEILDTKSRKGIFGFINSGREAMGIKSAKIKEIKSNVEDYDLVVIGTPVWAGRTSSPVNAFLSLYGTKINKYAVILTHGSQTDDYASVTEIFATKCKKPAIAFVSVPTKSINNSDFKAAFDFASKLKLLDSENCK